MIFRTIGVAFLLFSCGLVSSAQDPMKVAPDAYKLQFENSLVRVLRVHYAAHAKIPVHDHSKWPAAYVYLNDAGEIIFSHTDWKDPILTRRPVKGRSFRLSPTTAAGETHMVENPGDTASDFLRIEFKTLVQGSGLPHGRYPPEQYPPDKSFSKIHYENENVRVTRLACPTGQSLNIKADSGAVLVVVLSSTRIPATEGKYSAYQPGDTIWIGDGESKQIENLSSSPFEVLRFDFKTKSAKSKGAAR